MKLASRVFKTQDPIKTRAFKTCFASLRLRGQIFQGDKVSNVEIEFIRLEICTIYIKFQMPTHTVSQFKHSLLVSQTLSLKHQNQSSSTRQRATKITLTLTLKRSPLSSQSASDYPLTHTLKIPFVPTNGSSDFFKFEGMFFL